MSNKNSTLMPILKGVFLVIIGIVVVLLMQHYLFSLKPQINTSNQEVEKRIQPLASVVITSLPKTIESKPALSDSAKTVDAQANLTQTTTSAGNDSQVGKKTFESICTGCHSSGALGAPKFGNKKDWAPRIAQGMDALYANALKGKNSMPAKGGNPSLSDVEVKAAVDYMVTASK